MDIGALTALAGNALVNAAVTDAFEGMRAKLARLFGRGRADPGTEHRIDETRQQLMVAPQGQAAGALEAEARQWQARFADLLADHPEAEAEVRALVAELQAVLANAGGNVTNTISGTVRHGPVLMGRDFGDITFGEPPRDS